MAVIESIPEKNQTPSAQKGVLDYCMQPSKTFDELHTDVICLLR